MTIPRVEYAARTTLYHRDEQGHPGTMLTFVPWEHAAAGRNGDGLTEETAFLVPAASMGY